jgi:ParB-like chromosome segregation protein Spo0J
MSTEDEIVLHAAASIFPPLSEEAFDRLKADIKANGQNEPIVYWNGLLIDGRHRLRACEELGIEPMSCEIEPDQDPVAFVLSANLHRRQLKQSQRAMIAAKMANLKDGHRPSSNDEGAKREDAALMLSVSTASLDRAKYVLEHGSKQLIDAVEGCEVTVSLAEKLCKKESDKRKQSQLVKEGKEAIKEALTPEKTKAKAVLPSVDRPHGEPDDYDFPIVNAFSHADYRVNTLKKIVETLTDTERVLLQEFLSTSTKG